MIIDISKKDKVQVLIALYNAARPIWSKNYPPMTEEEARQLLRETPFIDYLHRFINAFTSFDKSIFKAQVIETSKPPLAKTLERRGRRIYTFLNNFLLIKTKRTIEK